MKNLYLDVKVSGNQTTLVIRGEWPRVTNLLKSLGWSHEEGTLRWTLNERLNRRHIEKTVTNLMFPR